MRYMGVNDVEDVRKISKRKQKDFLEYGQNSTPTSTKCR